MDEVIGNLGESLEFAESFVDDEDDAQDEGVNEITEQQDRVDTPQATHVLLTDSETASRSDSDRVNGRIVADVRLEGVMDNSCTV